MAQVTDPVCGMTFDQSQAAAQTTHTGTAYFFCSEDCRRTFEANPKEFVKTVSPEASSHDEPIPF